MDWPGRRSRWCIWRTPSPATPNNQTETTMKTETESKNVTPAGGRPEGLAAASCSALDAAMALVDFGPCRDGDPADWINVASPMCAHCIDVTSKTPPPSGGKMQFQQCRTPQLSRAMNDHTPLPYPVEPHSCPPPGSKPEASAPVPCSAVRCSPAVRLAVEWLCDTITEEIKGRGIVGPATPNAAKLRRVEAIRFKYGIRPKKPNY